MIFYQLYCEKCYLFFITKTTKEFCPICGWTMAVNFGKGIKMNIDIQRKMKVYIAASYLRKEEAQKLGLELEQKGFEILSDWHQVNEQADYHSGQRAIRDMHSVEQCDLFIEFVGDKDSKGGRHCELGLALAWNKKIILIGEIDTCIFTNLPYLPRMKNIEELLRKIS